MEELENQLPQGGEEEIVEEEELALPDMTDLGGAQLEAVKQANEQSICRWSEANGKIDQEAAS